MGVSRRPQGADGKSAAANPRRGANPSGQPLRNPRVAVTVADGPIEPGAFRHARLIGAAHARRLRGNRRPRQRCCACDEMNNQPGGVQHATSLIRRLQHDAAGRATAPSRVRLMRRGLSPFRLYAPTEGARPIPPSRREPVADRRADALPSGSPASQRL